MFGRFAKRPYSKKRAAQIVGSARRGGFRKEAGGVEMGGAPPAALKEWFCVNDAKVAKLSYMGKAAKLSAR